MGGGGGLVRMAAVETALDIEKAVCVIQHEGRATAVKMSRSVIGGRAYVRMAAVETAHYTGKTVCVVQHEGRAIAIIVL